MCKSIHSKLTERNKKKIGFKTEAKVLIITLKNQKFKFYINRCLKSIFKFNVVITTRNLTSWLWRMTSGEIYLLLNKELLPFDQDSELCSGNECSAVIYGFHSHFFFRISHFQVEKEAGGGQRINYIENKTPRRCFYCLHRTTWGMETENIQIFFLLPRHSVRNAFKKSKETRYILLIYTWMTRLEIIAMSEACCVSNRAARWVPFEWG